MYIKAMSSITTSFLQPFLVVFLQFNLGCLSGGPSIQILSHHLIYLVEVLFFLPLQITANPLLHSHYAILMLFACAFFIPNRATLSLFYNIPSSLKCLHLSLSNLKAIFNLST